MKNNSIVKNIDYSLILCYLLLIVIGWLNIYASVYSDEHTSILDLSQKYGKQFIWITTALILASFILFGINKKAYSVLSPIAYIIMLIVLAILIKFGAETNGSKSWIEVGSFLKFQPAELSKITTALFLSYIMSSYGFKLSKFRYALETLLILTIPMLLIILEKETGSALVYLGFIFVLYREGLSGWFLIFGLTVILLFIITLIFSPLISIAALTIIAIIIKVSLSYKVRDKFKLRRINKFIITAFACSTLIIFSVEFVFNNILQPHQQSRIENLLGITEDLKGAGYNVHQSKIAIGSGGITGKGFLNGTQTKYNFVPEQSTDFIFCTIGEEHGFVGALVVISLFLFLIIRLIISSEKQKDRFTKIYGYCVASIFFMHFFINIAMTIGIAPVIGIPLPFISYGGSSLWSFTTLLFIYIALDANNK